MFNTHGDATHALLRDYDESCQLTADQHDKPRILLEMKRTDNGITTLRNRKCEEYRTYVMDTHDDIDSAVARVLNSRDVRHLLAKLNIKRIRRGVYTLGCREVKISVQRRRQLSLDPHTHTHTQYTPI
eukprot:GHVR01162021.1.p1 GENE.GHVR01162021.1~~GHVR01162021.1.p1  ORF type:complete len:128 (-),score=45.04 GHVR01162021.1:41-424(-)